MYKVQQVMSRDALLNTPNINENISMSSSSSSSSHHRPPQFNGNNYSNWRPLIDAFLMKNGAEKVHLDPIEDFKEIEDEIEKWNNEDIKSALAVARGTASSSSSDVKK